MKIRPTITKLPFLFAAILLCLLAIQACEKRSDNSNTKPATLSQHDPGAPSEVYSKKHVKFPSIDAYQAILKGALHYHTDYCDEKHCCVCFTKLNDVIEQMPTKNVSPSQDPNCTGTCFPDWEPNAIHVSQWISYGDGRALEEFLIGARRQDN